MVSLFAKATKDEILLKVDSQLWYYLNSMSTFLNTCPGAPSVFNARFQFAARAKEARMNIVTSTVFAAREA